MRATFRIRRVQMLRTHFPLPDARDANHSERAERAVTCVQADTRLQ